MTSAETRSGFILPLLEGDEGSPFWQGCARGELLVQACAHCGRRRMPPRPMCPYCRSTKRRWEATSGRATVWSYVVVHPPLLPAYAELAPYNVVVVARRSTRSTRPRSRSVLRCRSCSSPSTTSRSRAGLVADGPRFRMRGRAQSPRPTRPQRDATPAQTRKTTPHVPSSRGGVPAELPGDPDQRGVATVGLAAVVDARGARAHGVPVLIRSRLVPRCTSAGVSAMRQSTPGAYSLTVSALRVDAVKQ